MEKKKKEKKQNKFIRVCDKSLNLDGLLFSGKYLLQLILLFVAVTFMLDWFINFGGEIKESAIFVAAFMGAVMLMPMYISYKLIRELEIWGTPTWIIIITAIGGIIFHFFPIF